MTYTAALDGSENDAAAGSGESVGTKSTAAPIDVPKCGVVCLSKSMLPIILHERNADWCAGLRRLLAVGTPGASAAQQPNTPPAILQSPIWGEALAALGRLPDAIFVVELTATNAPRVLDAIAALDREFFRVKTIVVTRQELADWELPARAAGAVHFATTLRELGPVIELAKQLRPTPVREASKTLNRLRQFLPISETLHSLLNRRPADACR